MLSYRHAFHAGNHADVLKHAVLALILDYLVQKDKPCWYVDTHAGAGSYSLADAFAQQNAEFATGIERLWSRRTQPPAPLRAYLAAVAAVNAGAQLRHYPGSPRLAAHLLRPQDRLVLFELHPQDRQLLARRFADDHRVRIDDGDGFDGLKAVLPPPSRRGLVLIDPPYELKEDYRRVPAALRDAHRRFATGIYMVWYPLLARPESARLARQLAALGLGPSLSAELRVRAPVGEFGLYGSGVFVLNPPWQLADQLEQLLPLLRERLGEDGAAATLQLHGQS
jgi:23S rRNA (adenine2030-N6)-methyltransferase